ncbi:MAG: class I SAM-dependent methyltransferase [Ignavibacteriaceae bacterium]
MFQIILAFFSHPKRFLWKIQEFSRQVRWEKYFFRELKLDERIKEIELNQLVKGAERMMENITFRPGGSTLPDHYLLVDLCSQYISCDYFEIGTFLGESISNVAPFCNSCVSLSLKDEEYAKNLTQKIKAKRVSRLFSGKIKNIKHFYEDSTRFNFDIIKERFDIVFVDGCHEYSVVKSDTKNAIKLLKNDNSIIVFHDAKNLYNEFECEVLCGIWDGLPQDCRNNLFTIENTLCAIYTKRKFTPIPKSDYHTDFYQMPKIKFSIKASLEYIK